MLACVLCMHGVLLLHYRGDGWRRHAGVCAVHAVLPPSMVPSPIHGSGVCALHARQACLPPSPPPAALFRVLNTCPAVLFGF